MYLQKTDDYTDDEDINPSVRGESIQSLIAVGQSSPEGCGND